MSDKMSDNGGMSDKMSDNGGLSNKMPDNEGMSVNKYRDALRTYLVGNIEISAAEAATIIGRTPKTARRVLLQLVSEGTVIATGANRNRKYKATSAHRNSSTSALKRAL